MTTPIKAVVIVKETKKPFRSSTIVRKLTPQEIVEYRRQHSPETFQLTITMTNGTFIKSIRIIKPNVAPSSIPTN